MYKQDLKLTIKGWYAIKPNSLSLKRIYIRNFMREDHNITSTSTNTCKIFNINSNFWSHDDQFSDMKNVFINPPPLRYDVDLTQGQFFKRGIATSYIEQVQEAAPHKAAAVRPPTTHHDNYQN